MRLFNDPARKGELQNRLAPVEILAAGVEKVVVVIDNTMGEAAEEMYGGEELITIDEVEVESHDSTDELADQKGNPALVRWGIDIHFHLDRLTTRRRVVMLDLQALHESLQPPPNHQISHLLHRHLVNSPLC